MARLGKKRPFSDGCLAHWSHLRAVAIDHTTIVDDITISAGYPPIVKRGNWNPTFIDDFRILIHLHSCRLSQPRSIAGRWSAIFVGDIPSIATAQGLSATSMGKRMISLCSRPTSPGHWANGGAFFFLGGKIYSWSWKPGGLLLMSGIIWGWTG